jgi:hypothetical protein
MKLQSIEFNGEIFTIGQKVRVSTGEPMPPARFNKKLAAWKHRNYIGVIEEIEEPRSYQPAGALVLSKPEYPSNAIITYRFHMPLPTAGRAYTITKEA